MPAGRIRAPLHQDTAAAVLTVLGLARFPRHGPAWLLRFLFASAGRDEDGEELSARMDARTGRLTRNTAGLLAALLLVAIAGLAVPPSASAAACVSGTTTWNGAVDSDFNNSGNWTAGNPTSTCDAVIGGTTTFTVTMASGVTVNSLTMNGTAGVQTLNIFGQSANTNLVATNGIVNGAHGAISLDCPGAGCFGGPAGAPAVDVRASTLTNAGSLTVTPAASGGGGFAGNVTNNGLMQING